MNDLHPTFAGKKPGRRPPLAIALPFLVLAVSWAAALAADGRTSAPDGLPPTGERHAVIISIDGLMPDAYQRPDELGVRVPHLRRLAAAGAYGELVGVLPSVTYPSHTTLVTGVPPAIHGITGNTVLDPEDRSGEAWQWYAGDVRVPGLVGAAEAAGRRTGAVFWPASVGLDADFLLPEFWRSGSSHPDDLKLLKLLSTPHLVEAVEAHRGEPFPYPLTDRERTDTAIHLVETFRPHLLLLHVFELDHEQHEHGPGSPEAMAALEESDALLGRVLAAVERAGIADRTLVAVVSDHGFLPVERELRPNHLLQEAGLVEVDGEGEVTSWRAWFHANGGSAALRLNPEADVAADLSDAQVVARVRELLAPETPREGLREVMGAERIAALGGTPEAPLWLDAESGYVFRESVQGPWSVPTDSRGHHGHAPDRPALHASLVLTAPGLERRGDLGVVPMTAVAPTVARWLSLRLDERAAEPLDLW